MYSLNLISCLILLFLGSIYVLTKPLSVGSKIKSDSPGSKDIANVDHLYLDDIALALIQNFDESSSSDEEGLIFDEGQVPADNQTGNNGNTNNNGNGVPAGNGKTGSNGSIIGSQGNQTSGNKKGGVVTAPDGTSTDLSNTTVNADGKVTDSTGNTVANVDKNGKVTDSKGNTVGTVGKDGNVVDNNGNTVAHVGTDGKVTPVVPVNNNGNAPSNGGVVTAPDGTTTDFSNTKVTDDGKVVDNNGNTVANVDKNGNVTDNKGNTIGKVDENGNIVDNQGNTVGNVDQNGNVTATPKPGVVTGPDGTTTDFTNTKVTDDGKIVDKDGNTVATVDKDGNVVDNNGNNVATLDKNGNIVDNNGNPVANVDKNGNVVPANKSTNKTPGLNDQSARDLENKKNGGFLYFLLPALALVGGAGAFLYKNKYIDEVMGKGPGHGETVTEMNNVGAAPTAAAVGPNGGSTTNTKTVGSQLPYDVVGKSGPSTGPTSGPSTTNTTTTQYGNMRPANAAAPTTFNNVREQVSTLPNIESGPSMDSLMREEFASPKNNKSADIGILPAVLAAGAAATAASDPKKTNKKSTTTTTSTNTYTTNNVPAGSETTRYGPVGTTKNISNVQSAPKSGITSTTKYVYPAADKATSSTTTTKNGFDSKYMLAPLAAGAALASTKNNDKDKKKTVNQTLNSYNTVSNKEKALPFGAKPREEEEIIEEYIVEQGSKKSPKKSAKKTVTKNVPVPVPIPVSSKDDTEEIIEEYIIEEDSSSKSRGPKKSIKKTTYKTIYKNGVPVQVPVTDETEGETRDLANVASTKENPYMGMVPMIIETIVKHSLPLGDKAEDEKKNDLSKLISKVTEINPESKTIIDEFMVQNKGGPKKTVKKTIYKTIYKNGVPVQVPVEEEVEESESSPKAVKSPKLKGLKKRITTYVSKDGKEVPVTEEFSLNPKDVSPEELPEEYKEFSSEELEVPGSKSQKQKTIKKYITVYKTIYKNGKPEEIVENIEVPEGKTPEEVLASLPRGTHTKPTGETIEKRYVTNNVIAAPTKESVIEERTVKPTTIKNPRVHSVKKYVTTYKTTYKNGVPVEEITESEDIPDQSATTETTYAPTEATVEEENIKSPRLKTVKKTTTYKTIYKNGVPVEVVEEEPEEIVLANPALVETRNVQQQPIVEEDSEVTLVKSPKLSGIKKFINKINKKDGAKSLPGQDTEEVVEEYIIENGVKKPKKTIKKTIYKTIYKNGVPVQVPVTEEVDGETRELSNVSPGKNGETEEVVEEYIIENGVKKPKKTIKKTIYKTIYKNGVPVQVPVTEDEYETKNVTTKNVVKKTPVEDEMEEIVEEYLIEEGSDGKPKKTVKRTTYRNGVPVSEEFDNVSEIPDDAMETEEIVEEYEIEEGKNQPPKTLKKTVYKTIYQNGVPVKVPVTEDEQVTRDISGSGSVNPYMKLAPTIIETIVKYACSDAGDHKDDLEKLISQVNEISNAKEAPVTETRNVTAPVPAPVPASTPTQTENDRGIVGDMVTNAVANKITSSITGGNNDNPYMKLAPSIIQMIVKYALPNASENDGKADLESLMSQVTSISKLMGSREAPEVSETQEAPVTETRNVTAPVPASTPAPAQNENERGIVGDMVTNAVANKITSSITGGNNDNPYMKLAPSIIQMIVKYALPNAKDNDDKADLESLMSQVTSISKLMGSREAPEAQEAPITETRNVTAPVPASAPAQNENERGIVGDMVTNAVANKITSSITGGNNDNPYMKLAPTIIETIVKYALPNAKDNDDKADLENLMSQVTSITKLMGSREAPEAQEAPVTETRNVTVPASAPAQNENERGIVGDMVTNAVANKITSSITGGNNDNPYMKLAPTIIQMIVKYALPNASENDGKADLDSLMSQVTSITKLMGSREGPVTETRDAKTIEGEEIVEEYLIEEGSDGKPKKTVKRTTYRNGVPVSEEYDEVSTIPDDAMETEEIVEEYEIEDGKDQSTIKKTVYKNGVLSEETTEEKPLGEYKFPLTPIKTTTEEEFSEALPSITEEDESKPMENNRNIDITSPVDTKFRKRQLPKRSSSRRLSAELKAAVAAEIAKLESEINDETKHIPRPRKQSISQSLSRKESKQSIKAMAEGCLVRKPSNASSIKSNGSAVEDWSGPVFEKKVFEVVLEHTPQLPDEVKLNIGDLVEVKQVFEDGWAYGINTATKIDGTFPVICLGEEREPNKNGRYVPRLIRVYQAREEAGKKEIEDEEKFKQDLTEFAKKKKEYKLKRQSKKYSQK